MSSPCLRRRRIAQALGVVALLPGRVARSQTFPAQPVTLIVPFPAGGPSDRYLRQLAELAAPHLGQPVIVVNRPGAAGTLALGQMALNARPDGYTVAMYQSSMFRVPQMQKLPWHPLDDFSFVVGLAGYRQALLVRADSPFRSLQDLLDAARRQVVNFGTAGVGSGGQMLMAQLGQLAGVTLTHVPFKGTADLVPALLGGHVHAICDVGGWEGLVEQGRLRLLVSFADRPSRRFPQVPTAQSLGWDLAIRLRFGLAAPRGLDPAVLRVLHDAFRKAMADPRHETLLEDANLEAWPQDSQAYRAWATSTLSVEHAMLERLGLLAR